MIEGRACTFSPRAGGKPVLLGHALFTTWPQLPIPKLQNSPAKEAREKTLTEEQKAKYNGGKTFKQNPVFRSEQRLSNVGKPTLEAKSNKWLFSIGKFCNYFH